MPENKTLAINIALEEYKALKSQIVSLIGIRSNIIIFGLAGIATLISVGIASIPKIPISTTTIIDKSSVEVTSPQSRTTETTIRYDGNNPPKIIGKEIKIIDTSPKKEITISTTPESTIQTYQYAQKEAIDNFYQLSFSSRLPSAIILGIVVPFACGTIIYFWYLNHKSILLTGRYIAINLEAKINQYCNFDDNNPKEKPLLWENYMQTLEFGFSDVLPVFSLFFVIGGASFFGGLFICISWSQLLPLSWLSWVPSLPWLSPFLPWAKVPYILGIISVIISIIPTIYFILLQKILYLQDIRDFEGSKERISYDALKSLDKNTTGKEQNKKLTKAEKEQMIKKLTEAPIPKIYWRQRL